MLKNEILNQVEKIYKQGGNIIQFLNQADQDLKEAILISYEYQAGTYIDGYKKNPTTTHKYTDQLISEMKMLGSFDSILEAGVGEATTLRQIITSKYTRYRDYYGFDISWSRLKMAQDFLKDTSDKANLFVAELLSIPLMDESIDVVYTSHSIEPNGGYEKPILEELYRITKNYLVLFEPDYEFADDEAKARMESHGYVKNLASTAEMLGYNVVKREPLAYVVNPLNPTSVIVIKKSDTKTNSMPKPFQCPITKTRLLDCGEIFFAPQAFLMYPVIQGIPCLLDSQAILGCKYGQNE